MTLLGRLRGFADGKLLIAADLDNTLAQGDAWFASLKKRMDDYAEKSGMAPPEESLMEKSAPALPPWSRPITSVVWCSGFRYDFAWVKLPILNDSGEPLHERGVTQSPGLYFLGLRRTYALSLRTAGGRRQRRGFHCRPHRR
jgi:putative flavoprotein involved in K+ transport